MNVLTETFTGFKIKVEDTIDDGFDEDFDGWYCVKTDPWPCPVCSVIVEYVTTNHLIIVYPEKDDENILNMARVCKEIGRNPKIIEYEKGMGPCISFYNFEFMVHN